MIIVHIIIEYQNRVYDTIRKIFGNLESKFELDFLNKIVKIDHSGLAYFNVTMQNLCLLFNN